MNANNKQECIFCEEYGPGNPLTGEHLWSDWMGKYLPIDSNAQRIEYSEDLKSEISLTPLFIERTRLGAANSKRINKVCERCNTVWMSQLETATKPFLLPLLLGDCVKLDRAAITAIAKWLTLKIMVVEHDAFRGRVPMTIYSKEDRNSFRSAPYIPDGMRVWIAPGGGPKWRTGFNRYVGGIRLTKALPGAIAEPNFVRAGANIQSITWGIGRTLFHVIATTEPKFWKHFAWEVPTGFTPMWPLDEDVIDWPPGYSFPDWALDDAAQALREISKTFPKIRSDGTLFPPG